MFKSVITIVTAAQEPMPCTVCHEGAGVLMAALNSTKSLQYQADIVIEEGCSNWPDPNGCALAVTAWWGRMANVVYNSNFTTFAPSCYCNWDFIFSKNSWNCDSCQAHVKGLAEVGMSQETGIAIQEVLQGPAFCEAEDMGLSGEEVAACKQFTDGIGGAFRRIFYYVGQQAFEICSGIVYNGICGTHRPFLGLY